MIESLCISTHFYILIGDVQRIRTPLSLHVDMIQCAHRGKKYATIILVFTLLHFQVRQFCEIYKLL